ANAPTFFDTNPAAGGDLLSGLTAAQLGQIANWNLGISHALLWNGNPSRPDSFETALTNLGIPHTTYGVGQFTAFNSAVASANPASELIIMSSPSDNFGDSNNISSFIAGGG